MLRKTASTTTMNTQHLAAAAAAAAASSAPPCRTCCHASMAAGSCGPSRTPAAKSQAAMQCSARTCCPRVSSNHSCACVWQKMCSQPEMAYMRQSGRAAQGCVAALCSIHTALHCNELLRLCIFMLLQLSVVSATVIHSLFTRVADAHCLLRCYLRCAHVLCAPACAGWAAAAFR
jgi:hypothetical protein